MYSLESVASFYACFRVLKFRNICWGNSVSIILTSLLIAISWLGMRVLQVFIHVSGLSSLVLLFGEAPSFYFYLSLSISIYLSISLYIHLYLSLSFSLSIALCIILTSILIVISFAGHFISSFFFHEKYLKGFKSYTTLLLQF